jgi:hypothetical protein
MKLRFVAISAICVLALCTGLTWAQNGAAARNGGQNGSANCINAATSTSLQPLTTEEKYWLLYLSREEKLALDVYLELYEKLAGTDPEHESAAPATPCAAAAARRGHRFC